jgi:hypothetical protein
MGQFEDGLKVGYNEHAQGLMDRAWPGEGPQKVIAEGLDNPMMDTPSMNPDFDATYGSDGPKPPRIEEEAHDLVFGDRQAAYGHPASDFTAMGRITAAILSRWLESKGLAVVDEDVLDEGHGPVYMPDIDPEVVALIMTAVKLSRQSAQSKRDNLVDLIGYTLCADRIIEGE